MDTNEVINRIGYFRSKTKLSARELSLQINKSDTYINKLESRDFVLSLPVLFDIIEVLKISCAEFFSDNYTNYRQDKEILDLLGVLSKERKNSFIDLMRNSK